MAYSTIRRAFGGLYLALALFSGCASAPHLPRKQAGIETRLESKPAITMTKYVRKGLQQIADILHMSFERTERLADSDFDGEVTKEEYHRYLANFQRALKAAFNNEPMEDMSLPYDEGLEN